MEAKECSKCKKDRPLEDFAWKNKSQNRRSAECKECHRVIRNQFYKDNHELERERIYKHRKKQQKELYEFVNSLKIKCNRCNENRTPALQFHHVDPTTKETTIAEAVGNGWSKERVQLEINKCEVICANCHMVEHFS